MGIQVGTLLHLKQIVVQCYRMATFSRKRLIVYLSQEQVVKTVIDRFIRTENQSFFPHDHVRDCRSKKGICVF